MPKRDQSQEALQVEQIIGSKPVRGETLLRSRKLREAKKRLKPNTARN
jgi:ribosomal protein L28